MHFFARMAPWLVVLVLVAYFAALVGIAYFTKDDSNTAFFSGKKQSPWYVVAFGMIGASLSGVTFISVPGWVESSQFSYFQMVLGYLPGYWVIAGVLLPLYYKLNLTSIYTYLRDRFGIWSYRSGAMYFLLSRIIGASFRLYLVAITLDYVVFQELNWDVPFIVTVSITIALIWLYTNSGGIKTIIWTDTLQTLFMLLAVVLTIWGIGSSLGWSLGEMVDQIAASEYSQTFFFDDWNDKRHFVKNFLAGMFIAIVMTGLDQDMMQKNLSCKNLKEAQKNMYWFSTSLVFVNALFLGLGALLFLYAGEMGIAIPEKKDYLFATIAMGGTLNTAVGLLFIVGLVAAAYSSADSALTSLTTSFCIDFLDVESKDEKTQIRLRKQVHIGMSIVLILVISGFKLIHNDSVIAELFTAAGFTYGPLLGLFAFGLFTTYRIIDRRVVPVVVLAPIVSYFLKKYSVVLFGGYQLGFEVLLVNGLLTFIGLMLIISKDDATIRS